MVTELLCEIGTEEIPARMAQPAADALREQFAREMEAAGLAPGDVQTLVTPRRLALLARGLAARQADRVDEKLGPAARVAFDAEGKPTPAGLGFARGQGVDVDALRRVTTPKGEYVAVVKTVAGRPAAEILPELLARVTLALPFPKSMRWGSESTAFVRPIHWLVLLLDGAVLPLTLAGISAGNQSRGHRFLAPEPFEVRGIDDYLERLAAAHVVLDPAERRRRIVAGLDALTADAGGAPVDDPGLLDTVTHLVELPTVTLGRFSKAYLEVPEDILVSAMRTHQKYFAWRDAGGRLLPCFAVVSNTRTDDMATVTRGNERVLRARLDDARFFFRTDRKRRLEQFLPALEQRLFLKPLGSMRAKVDRVAALAGTLADRLAPDARDVACRAAALSKADLATEVVGEFPDLQGIIGAAYATLDGEPDGVATAILEHYLPRFAGDRLPATAAGAVVALADKADGIVGCFGVGLAPTGTQDPYALRRQALGILHVLLDREARLGLDTLVGLAIDGYGDGLQVPRETLVAQVLEFFRGRLRVLLSADQPVDVVDAVLEVAGDQPVDARDRVLALAAARREPAFDALAAAFKRIGNIIKGQDAPGAFDEALVAQDEERALHAHWMRIRADVDDQVARRDHAAALVTVSTLKPVVDQFFDHVLVMDKSRPDIQRNRLALLNGIAATFRRIAEFSKLQVEKT